MFRLRFIRFITIIVTLLPALCLRAAEPSAGRIPSTKPQAAKCIDIAPAWAGHPVGFALLTNKEKQFVAYYDADRRMTVASRSIDSDHWTFQVLPTSVGWDSHNSIKMAMDDAGQLHVSGNMHAGPLIYFKTTRAGDVTSLEQVQSLIGKNEKKCTYPSFLRGPEGEFIFTYRDGHSGDGNQIYDVYDSAAGEWHRLLDQPLTDGQGLMNAYFQGPTRGQDGYFHLCWVWRDTGACETNHDLSYAKSKDLRHWETASGKPLALPLTLENCDRIDPVPPGGGIINNNTMIGFDQQKRIIISYHKFDAAGNTQVYSARFENGAWKIYQTSDWQYRWDFKGGGSIPFEIRLGGVRVESDGSLSQTYQHAKYGAGTWKLDPEILKPIGTIDRPPAHSADLEKVESDFPGMKVNWASDTGRSPDRGVQYELRWETLGVDRDKPRQPPLPPATMLRVYGLAR